MSVAAKLRCAVAGVQETCEACGGTFQCGPMWNCWCFHENAPKAALETIKQRHAHCLCPDCLRKVSEAHAPSNPD